MTAPLVDYLIARHGPPPRSGSAYDYVVAGDGLHLVAENALLSVRVPVCRGTVRGLPPIYAACALKAGRLPRAIWLEIVDTARTWALAGHEVLLAAVHDARFGAYRLVRPPQIVGAARVFYRPTEATLLEIHSHHRMRAYFSRTDDADEQGLRLYGVVGRLDAERPEVALRAGAYGHFLPVPWADVFDGDLGDFRDTQFETEEDQEDIDDVPR
jgi:PRTRC genetic system protein A